MRYLIHVTQQDEVPGRQQYLYDICHMYFIPGKTERGFIPLTPIGSKEPDVLFITGHTGIVRNYLKTYINTIPEETIVITSCFGQLFKTINTRKTIYVPDTELAFCCLRDGRPYGFDFVISDAELEFYNGTGNIMDRIQSAYKRLE